MNKTLCLLVTLGIVSIVSQSVSYGSNSYLSAQAIANFKYNNVKAESILSRDMDYVMTPMNREGMAEIIVGLREVIPGLPVPVVKENPFKDTQNSSAVLSYSLGYMYGKSGTVFDPNENLSREEFATILIRFLNSSGVKLSVSGDTNNITDFSSVSSWASSSVRYCLGEGFMNGRYHMNGYTADPLLRDFDPKTRITIEEALGTLDRVFTKYGYLKQSPNLYYGGFYIPQSMSYGGNSGGINSADIGCYWNAITDRKAFENDILEIMELNFGNNPQNAEVIAFLKPTTDISDPSSRKTFLFTNGEVICTIGSEWFSIWMTRK